MVFIPKFDKRPFKKDKGKWVFHCLNCEKKVNSHDEKSKYYYVWDSIEYGYPVSRYNHLLLCSKKCVSEMCKKVAAKDKEGIPRLEVNWNIEREKIYERFMDFATSNYDSLAYHFRFSSFKRVTMDRSSYLEKAELFFDEYYPSKLEGMSFNDALGTLVDDFNEKVEIVEIIKNK